MPASVLWNVTTSLLRHQEGWSDWFQNMLFQIVGVYNHCPPKCPPQSKTIDGYLPFFVLFSTVSFVVLGERRGQKDRWSLCAGFAGSHCACRGGCSHQGCTQPAGKSLGRKLGRRLASGLGLCTDSLRDLADWGRLEVAFRTDWVI